ncbi:MAG: LptF/LptG family permease, partial [Bacteroidota bacterium]
VTFVQVLVNYYLNFMLWINGLLWPLFSLIAVIFFTSRMAYNSEIISILNAGVSFRRLLVPYLIGAGVIAGLHLLANHFLIPMGNKSRLDFEHTYIWKDSDKAKTSDIHMKIGAETYVYIRFYKKRDTLARNLRIEEFENNQMVMLLKAESAKWIGRPNKWKLRNYEIRTFDGMNETLRQGGKEHLDTTINMYPEDFVRYLNQKEMITTPKLVSFINSEKERGVGNTKTYEIELHRRTADPFTIIILTLIGTAVAGRKVRGGIGLHLAVGIGLGASFVFLSRISQTFATNDNLSPLLAVWIPNIIFGLIALYLVSRAQK